MKTIAFAFLVLCSNPEDSTVFICDSPSSEVYPLDENCEGLKRCKHEVKTIPLDEVKSLERRWCGFEDEK
jgi:hypothetical protein